MYTRIVICYSFIYFVSRLGFVLLKLRWDREEEEKKKNTINDTSLAHILKQEIFAPRTAASAGLPINYNLSDSTPTPEMQSSFVYTNIFV